MYLRDLLHINDAFEDTINVATSPSTTSQPLPNIAGSSQSAAQYEPTPLLHINYTKRHQLSQVIHGMLRHQSEKYPIAEDPIVMNFIKNGIEAAAEERENELQSERRPTRI